VIAAFDKRASKMVENNMILSLYFRKRVYLYKKEK